MFHRLFFTLPPEEAHRRAMQALAFAHRCGLVPAPPAVSRAEMMGLSVLNRVGLAAGFDKNAEYVGALAALGFGFVEVGTITPRPQAGNPPPRVFRLRRARALINRLGFNNCGAQQAAQNIRRSRASFEGAVGANIGKNRNTPLQNAAEDYLFCLETLYAHADYFVVNISSPNTEGLRDLQKTAPLEQLISALLRRRDALEKKHGRRAPLAVKISPDLDEDETAAIAVALNDAQVDGVVAANTTLARPDAVRGLPHAEQQGGLSGAPLEDKANAITAALRSRLRASIPIIGAGGICSARAAKDKMRAGADFVQLYTGFIYEGPPLVSQCARACDEFSRAEFPRAADNNSENNYNNDHARPGSSVDRANPS